MKRAVLAYGLMFAIAFSGYAFAAPQPLTRADCTKAGMSWDDTGNVCAGGAAVTPSKDDTKKGDKDGKKHDGDKKKDGDKGDKKKDKKSKKDGKKPSKKVVKKVHGNKVTKKVTTSEGTKKTTEKKGASKKEQRKFLKWLKQQDKKS